ncbi:MAG: lactate dehydrogenase, partial [Hyphomonas sp.]|nr:lactate dehydrogenase [Hyphomonas sp.]
EAVESVATIKAIQERFQSVRRDRLETTDKAVNKLAAKPHQFRERKGDGPEKIFVPIVSSENREYFPAGLSDETVVPTNKAFYMATGEIWPLAIISSRIHLAWIATVCGRLRSDYSYSNILGWNTFPVPTLTEKNKADLTRCAEDILLAREHYFPATIADMYDPDRMDEEFPLVREAHERNDETLERIYIGRRFKNDTERLEKLFDLYTKMTAAEDAA